MVVATALPGGARLSCARGGKAHATASPLRQPRPPTSSPAAAGCRPPRLTRPARPPPPSASSISASQADPSPPPSPSHPLIRLVALCPAGVASPVARGEATWAAVLAHEGLRLAWSDAAIALTVFEDEGTDGGAWDAAVARADGVVVASVPDDGATGAAARALLARPSLAAVPTVAPLGCGPALTTALWRSGGVRAYPTSMLGRAAAALPWSRTAAARAAAGIAAGLWARSHSDDALAALAVVLDAGGTPQPSVEALKGRGPCTLLCMLTHCREQVLACVTDPTCKAGLDALTAAPPGDAVAAYRAITSFECDAFSAFSLCVLQKHRCLGVDAEIPARPYHPPAASWRGQPLTHELAETIFVGWLAGGDPISWHVAAGQNPGALRGRWRERARARARAFSSPSPNLSPPPTSHVVPSSFPAFDQFPSQLQLFYYGAAKGAFWYDPVFQVETMDGRTLWRRRHYRVRRAAEPGTFHFSVLDSGVVSAEFWTIVAAADDLSWALFAYRGAAAASGQSYIGSVLCTRDGQWPAGSGARAAIKAALSAAGVEEWEMFETTTAPDALQTAPLGMDRSDAAADPIFGPSGGGRRKEPVEK